MKSYHNYVKVPVPALLDHKLKPTDLRILQYLSWRQGDKKYSWPSERRIAKDLHLALWTVELSLARLRKTRYLTVGKKPGAQGRKNTYAVKLQPARKAVTRAQRPAKDKALARQEKIKRVIGGKTQTRLKQQRKADQPAAEKKTTKTKERKVQNGAE